MKNATIYLPMLICENEKSSHPIKGIPDEVHGFYYRRSPNGRIDVNRWEQWISEPRALSPPSVTGQRIIFVDNCSSHGENHKSKDYLRAVYTTIRKLPANDTDVVQSEDSFVIRRYQYSVGRDGVLQVQSYPRW